MSKLLSLKAWVTLKGAAEHLTAVMGETVSVADVLRLALDSHLTLSVYLVNHAEARCGRVVGSDDVLWDEVPAEIVSTFPHLRDVSGGKTVRVMRSVQLDQVGSRYLNLDDTVKPIDGIWDLPLIGAERLDIENCFQKLTGGPDVTLTCLKGVFLSRDSEQICILQERFGKANGVGDDDDHSWDQSDPGHYPAGSLPADSVVVVRTANLALFLQRLNGGSEPSPVGERERATLLVIIAALANEAGVDLSKPSKAAALIEGLTVGLGARVAARTIEGHLGRVPDALERRSST